jgi:hypothetical protein
MIEMSTVRVLAEVVLQLVNNIGFPQALVPVRQANLLPSQRWSTTENVLTSKTQSLDTVQTLRLHTEVV